MHAPSSRAAAAAHLYREVLPRDAGFEDEENAGQSFAVADWLAAGVTEASRFGGRQQRLNDLAQVIGDKRLGQDNTATDDAMFPLPASANGIPIASLC